MRSFRNILFLLLALVLGWIFLSRPGDKMGKEKDEAAQDEARRGQVPKGKLGLVPSESATGSLGDESLLLRVPTQEPRAETALARTPETSPESAPVSRSTDRRLQRIEKSISEYDDESFDERMLDDEALLDQFGQGNIPVGRRGDESGDASDTSSRSRYGDDPFEGDDEDSSYPSAR